MATRHKLGESVDDAKKRLALAQMEWRKKNHAHWLRYRKQYDQDHKEQTILYKKRTREKNPEKWKTLDRERCRRWRARLGETYKERMRQRIRNIKIETIKAYGEVCACCGESRMEFLTIDHINGRKDKGDVGNKLYIRLKKLGWPKDEFRLLCMNCNFSFGKYGYCPHERTPCVGHMDTPHL